MITEKNSRICFCIEFELIDYEDFLKNLPKILKDVDPDVDVPKMFKRPLELERIFPFNSMIKRFTLTVQDIQTKKDNVDELKREYLKQLKKETIRENKERIKKDIVFLENDLKKSMEIYKNPLGTLRLELRTTDKTDESQIMDTFKISPENKILTYIESASIEKFEFNLCGFILLSKDSYSYKHGFTLGQELIFSKDIMEKIGSTKISEIGLDIQDSPIGIKKLIFGDRGGNINLDIEMTFKTNKISDINEKISIFFDLIKNFFEVV